MREIKFRAWDTFEKEMIYDAEMEYDGVYNNSFGHFLHDINWYHEDNPLRYKVSQYTGILDLEGKRIYEGDILRGLDYPCFDEGDHNYYITIEWIFNSWQGVYNQISNRVLGVCNGANFGIEEEILNGIVIGNIYETPELLKIND